MAKEGTKLVIRCGKDDNHGKRSIFLYNFSPEDQQKLQYLIEKFIENPNQQVIVRESIPLCTEEVTPVAVEETVSTSANIKEFKAVGIHESENNQEWYSVVLTVKRDLISGNIVSSKVEKQSKESGKIHALYRAKVDFGGKIN